MAERNGMLAVQMSVIVWSMVNLGYWMDVSNGQRDTKRRKQHAYNYNSNGNHQHMPKPREMKRTYWTHKIVCRCVGQP